MEGIDGVVFGLEDSLSGILILQTIFSFFSKIFNSAAKEVLKINRQMNKIRYLV